MRVSLRQLLRVACALFFFTLARSSAAHDPFELTTTARISPAGMTLVTTATRGCALALLDPQRPLGSSFSPDELPQWAPRLRAAAAGLYEMSQGGRRLTSRSTRAELNVEGEVVFTVDYPAPAPGPLEIVAQHVRVLGNGYASALTLTQDEPPGVLGMEVFTSELTRLVVEVRDASPAAEKRPEKVDPTQLGFARTFVLGVEHILAGLDHLLFLAGLLVACRRLRPMLAIVTAFTVAHSITLALAALDRVVLPDRLVEPLIAASIVLVGVENLVRKEVSSARAALCFLFGLVHGFGFAGALRELGLGRDGAPIALPLLGFNLGVEAGQLLVVAVLLPGLLLLRRKPAISRWLLPAASSCIVVAGVYWLLERVFWS